MPYARTKQDRTKAIALAVFAHVVIGVALVGGLAVRASRMADPPLESFDLAPPPTPAPHASPPPKPARDAAARDAGRAAAKAIPTALVVPKPVVPLPASNPMPTADRPEADLGSDRRSGASASGAGTGAGGEGSGNGGGGSAGLGSDAGQGTGARLLSGNLNRRDYRLIRRFGSSRGNAVLAMTIGGDGRVLACSASQSSGSADLDRTLCALMGRTAWAPALDGNGRPVTSALRYVATWERD